MGGTARSSRRKAAKAFLAQVATDQARGQWVDRRGGTVRFEEWAERWLAYPVVRRSTMRSYRSQLRKHLIPTFGALQLRQITPLTVRGWVAATLQTLRPKTVQDIHATLSRILAAAIDEPMLLSNPCAPTPGLRRCPCTPRPSALCANRCSANLSASPRRCAVTAVGSRPRTAQDRRPGRRRSSPDRVVRAEHLTAASGAGRTAQAN